MQNTELKELTFEELQTIDGGKKSKYVSYLAKGAGGGAVGGAISGGIPGAVIGANLGAIWGSAAYVVDSAISGKWK